MPLFALLHKRSPFSASHRIVSPSSVICRVITRLRQFGILDNMSGIADPVVFRLRADVWNVKTQTSRHRWTSLSRKVTAALILAFALPVLSNHAVAQESVRVKWNPNPETDIAGYTVFLGTKSGYYSTTQKILSGTSATLAGLVPDATYYCAVQAYNVAGITSELSDEISFSTLPKPGLFIEWTAVAGLKGAAAEPAATPFNDGVRNLVKYAFNMNGSGSDTRVLAAGTGTAGLPRFMLIKNGAQSVFKVEFLRRKGDELIYTPKTTTNLVTYKPMTGTTTVTGIDGDWERVIVQTTIDLSSTPMLFGRVEVTQNQTQETIFNSWASSGGLSGAAAAASARPFNDGVSNLLKYASNMTSSGPDNRVLASGTGTAGLPVFGVETSGSQKWFKVEYMRRKHSGLVYVPKISTDLVNYAPMTGSTSVTSIDADWDRVTVRKSIDTATTPKLFGIVEVSLP
jgi:hypothetical protein